MRWLLLPAALLLLFMAILWILYRIAFASNPRGRREDPFVLPKGEQYQARRSEMLRLIRAFAEIPCEHVWITAQDGIRLHGRYYPVCNGAPLEIEFHGYRGSALRDFSGGSVIARNEGRNVLLVDQRAHGESGGRAITLGLKERFDCVAWIRWAIDRFGPEVRILLAGVSMGAATVLMASGLSLPENVRGVVADCPYSAPEAILRKVAGDFRLPGRLSASLLVLSARIFAGVSLRQDDPVRASSRSRIPILILHGEDDRFVPCSMSAEIAAANPTGIRRVTFPGAGHGLSYLVEPRRYTEEVRRFTREVL